MAAPSVIYLWFPLWISAPLQLGLHQKSIPFPRQINHAHPHQCSGTFLLRRTASVRNISLNLRLDDWCSVPPPPNVLREHWGNLALPL